MSSKKALFFILLPAVLLLAAVKEYRIVARYPVPGDGGFDYLGIDSQARRIYVSHATKVDVVDADTGKIMGMISDTPGVHGAVVVSEFKHGFTSNGREHKVSMFDPTTLQLIRKIDVGKGPDGIYYDPGSKRVFTNNHGSHDVSAVDAKTGEVVGTVKLDGDGEQAVIGADGLVYVNSENTNEVIVFDPRSLEVKKRFPVEAAKTPTALAYDAKTNRLFIGCRNEPKMAVMNAGTGKVITSFRMGTGVDYAAFDPEARLIFFSCGQGVLNVFHEKSADSYEDAGSVTTQPGAKTMAFDTKTKKIFLPGVEYLESPTAEGEKRSARTIKPGSFTLLVLAR